MPSNLKNKQSSILIFKTLPNIALKTIQYTFRLNVLKNNMEYMKLRNRSVIYNCSMAKKYRKQNIKKETSNFELEKHKWNAVQYEKAQDCSDSDDSIIFVSDSRSPIETIDLTDGDWSNDSVL